MTFERAASIAILVLPVAMFGYIFTLAVVRKWRKPSPETKRAQDQRLTAWGLAMFSTSMLLIAFVVHRDLPLPFALSFAVLGLVTGAGAYYAWQRVGRRQSARSDA